MNVRRSVFFPLFKSASGVSVTTRLCIEKYEMSKTLQHGKSA